MKNSSPKKRRVVPSARRLEALVGLSSKDRALVRESLAYIRELRRLGISRPKAKGLIIPYAPRHACGADSDHDQTKRRRKS
jgi:hypothetical protein